MSLADTVRAQHPQVLADLVDLVAIQSVSADPAVRADVILLGVFEGQRLLMCSDGLSDYVPLPRLTQVLSAGTPQSAADELRNEAVAHGSRDNITVVVADVVDRDDNWPASVTLGAAAGFSLASPA